MKVANLYDSIMLSKISSTASTKRGSAFLLHDITMLGPSAIPLAIQIGRDVRSLGQLSRPLPAARERRLPRVAFAGGWKAQGPNNDHTPRLGVELTRRFAASGRRAESGWAQDGQ